jgi:hypothetical protein
MRKSPWSSPTATAGKKLPITALATNCLQKRNIFLTRKGEFSFYYIIENLLNFCGIGIRLRLNNCKFYYIMIKNKTRRVRWNLFLNLK